MVGVSGSHTPPVLFSNSIFYFIEQNNFHRLHFKKSIATHYGGITGCVRRLVSNSSSWKAHSAVRNP
jgi:hypothetical protein